MNRLVLIDGNAILHRAYHAIPPLTAPDGTVVNAVYGFSTMLMRIFHDLAPSHVAVAFDRPKPTFRKKMFDGYQSKRPKMDEELAGQISRVHDVIRAFGIPIYEKDGFEADDVLGTLATEAAGEGIDQVVIVTGDRDILQLVTDRVYVYMPTKGLSEAKLYMEKDVKERLGVAPAHVTDFKGFAGDASDNYPGVGGIGPKTAVTLIETFGSVEALYTAIKKNDKRLEKFSSAVLEKLKNGEDAARLSKELATIVTNVPLEGGFRDAHVVSLDTPAARKILEELHFHSLLKRLTGGANDKDTQKEKKSPHRRPAEEAGKKTNEQQALF